MMPDGYVIETLVSIHTPAWGVTSIYNPIPNCPTCFNPHSRMGSDLLH